MKRGIGFAAALVAGLVGGTISRYISPVSALAQGKTAPAAEIRAQSFVLVDSSDQTVGTFTTTPRANARGVTTGSRIVLRDKNGREIWSAGGVGVVPVSER